MEDFIVGALKLFPMLVFVIFMFVMAGIGFAIFLSPLVPVYRRMRDHYRESVAHERRLKDIESQHKKRLEVADEEATKAAENIRRLYNEAVEAMKQEIKDIEAKKPQ